MYREREWGQRFNWHQETRSDACLFTHSWEGLGCCYDISTGTAVFPTTGYSYYYSLILMTDCRILQVIFADTLLIYFKFSCCNQQRQVVWKSPIKHAYIGNALCGLSNSISCQGFQWDTAVLPLKLVEWSTHHFVTSITSIAVGYNTVKWETLSGLVCLLNTCSRYLL